MQRRSFLSAVVVAPVAAGVVAAGVVAMAATEQTPRFRFEVVRYSRSSILTIRVTAAPTDVEGFCLAYQDALWPAWKTHPNRTARDMITKIMSSRQWQQGHGLVDVTHSQQRHAFFATCSAFGVPNAEISHICLALVSDSPSRG